MSTRESRRSHSTPCRSLLFARRLPRCSCKQNPESNELWLRKYGTLMKILGPIMILFGLAELFGVIR
jgi:hypothetical protein